MSATLGFRHFLQETGLILRRAQQVWAFVPLRRRMVLGAAAFVMALTSCANTLVALLLGQLVDQARPHSESPSQEDVYWAAGCILAALVGIYIVREMLNVLRRALVENAVTKINRDMQLRLVRHVLKSNLTALSAEKVGTLHGKIFRNVEGLVRFVRLMFLDCVPTLLTGLFALVAAISKQPILGFVMMGVIPAALWLTVRQLQTQKSVRLHLMRDVEDIDGTVVEQLSGAEYIRVANTYKQEMERLGQKADKRRKREIRHHFEMSLYGCAKSLNEGLFHIIVLGLAVYLAVSGQISYGDILTFSVLFLNVMTPINEIHRVLDEGHEASLRVGDMIHMLAEPADVSFRVKPNGPLLLHQEKPIIQANDLWVHYEVTNGRMKRAIEGMSLSVKRGETIGIAGRSGAGKSTWIKVLLRLLHPKEGEILLSGEPLANISREELARLMGYVGQTPFVFSGTIAENIAYGTEITSLDKIQEAAELANFHDEIMEMPGDYDFMVTEKGQNLSGGQRQRLALARILLKRAPILILDEATSALDNISERHIQRSLGMTNGDRTTLLIAHRLTTLMDCDRIVVFNEGKITQVGTYPQLVQESGVFQNLVRSAEFGVNGTCRV